jgi:hypothetical protein
LSTEGIVTEDDWRTLVYRAWGIPDVIVDKRAAAERIVAERSWKAQPDNAPAESARRDAEREMLDEVLGWGGDSRLDHYIMGWESLGAVVDRLEMDSRSRSQARPEKTKPVLEAILPDLKRWVDDHRFAVHG